MDTVNSEATSQPKLAVIVTTDNEKCDISLARSLTDLMLTEGHTDICEQIAGALGTFLASRRCPDLEKKDLLCELTSGSIRGPPRLYEWLLTINSREALDRLFNEHVLPPPYSKRRRFDRFNRCDWNNNRTPDDSLSTVYSRLVQALSVLRKRDSTCFETVTASNITCNGSEVKLNAARVCALGTRSLEAATFVVDSLFIYKCSSLTISYSILYNVVWNFFSCYNDQLNNDAFTHEKKRKIWADILLLSGWEFIRRVITREYIGVAPRKQLSVKAGLTLILTHEDIYPGHLVDVVLGLVH